MTKLEFMKELESLLLDIPLEEREEALQYYNGYFEDAGDDHEDEIIKELGSPKRVASIIKADLNSNGDDRESRGYFTEKGYQDTIYKEEKFELMGADKKEAADNQNQNSTGHTNNTGNTNNAGNANNTGNADNTNGPNGNANANQSAYQKAQTDDKNTKLALIILLCIFGSPVILGIGGAIFGVAVGVIAAIGGIIIGFGAAGIALIGAGIALLIAGLLQISVPYLGLLLCGSGLVMLGLGMLFMILCVVLCKNVFPAIVKGIINLCRMPFKNRSVTA